MVNKLIYQGRLVRDIELKRTDSDVCFTEFSIAWSEKYKEAESKCFLRCKAWRNNAEFLSNYFSKGKELIIEGHLVTEEWEKDGEKQSRTICLVDKVHFCGSRGEQSAPEQAAAKDDGFMNIPDGIEEELPFN